MSHEADDNMGYDPSDVAFTEWLGSKKFNYKMMDHYTKKALWIYWIRGDDEVELMDEEFSDNEDEVAKVFRIDTNIFDFETPICKTFNEFNYLLQIDPDLLTKDIKGFKTYEEFKDDWIYEWNKDIPWVDEKPWTDAGVWTEPTPVKHYSKPFNYSWKNDRYYNGGNLLGVYIVGDSLHYQDYEWYEALMDSELKEQALRNKAIMEGLISDDESSNDGWRIWESHKITYHDHDELEYKNETHDERQELCKAHELPECNMRRFKMIKYSFGQNEEYVAIEEDEYDDLAGTSDDAIKLGSKFNTIVHEYVTEPSRIFTPKRKNGKEINDFKYITILKTNTPYPSRRYDVSVPALTKRPQKIKDQYADHDNDICGGVLKNKARLNAQGFRQEEGIYFKESFALVSRIEAIPYLRSKCQLTKNKQSTKDGRQNIFLKWRAQRRGSTFSQKDLLSRHPDRMYTSSKRLIIRSKEASNTCMGNEYVIKLSLSLNNSPKVELVQSLFTWHAGKRLIN
ncbi:hypothetical protein Tco_0821618 [Tanacetum coccineum]|uniref:Uncharacterized protein n=1 Tax=Tanacetum coccineum TaxID=301880 RepID=A0ABQ5AH60_9ASTR